MKNAIIVNFVSENKNLIVSNFTLLQNKEIILHLRLILISKNVIANIKILQKKFNQIY